MLIHFPGKMFVITEGKKEVERGTSHVSSKMSEIKLLPDERVHQ